MQLSVCLLFLYQEWGATWYEKLISILARPHVATDPLIAKILQRLEAPNSDVLFTDRLDSIE